MASRVVTSTPVADWPKGRFPTTYVADEAFRTYATLRDARRAIAGRIDTSAKTSTCVGSTRAHLCGWEFGATIRKGAQTMQWSCGRGKASMELFAYCKPDTFVVAWRGVI
jgi:hypothetical protein